MGSNVTTCYVTAPLDHNQTLGIKLPFLVMIIKNVKKIYKVNSGQFNLKKNLELQYSYAFLA
jgi:hypothetical protein